MPKEQRKRYHSSQSGSDIKRQCKRHHSNRAFPESKKPMKANHSDMLLSDPSKILSTTELLATNDLYGTLYEMSSFFALNTNTQPVNSDETNWIGLSKQIKLPIEYKYLPSYLPMGSQAGSMEPTGSIKTPFSLFKDERCSDKDKEFHELINALFNC